MAAAAIAIARHHAEELARLNKLDIEEVEGNDDIYATTSVKTKGEKSKPGLLQRAFSCCGRTKVAPVNSDGSVESPEEEIEPSDMWFNSKYWPRLPAPLRWYLDIALWCNGIVNDSNSFNNGVTLTIIVAGINVGAQTYPGMDTNWFFNILDNVILAIFTIELLMKILMEGLRPWKFVVGPEWAWNNFDFVIVALSFPVWGLEGGGSIALLRLVRLARLGKLIKKIPALQMIMKGLAGGLSSITYIMVLLFLVFYLFGVVGFYAFSVNDPFHFGTLPLSMLTLFRLATLENWGDIMFLNIFGCDTYLDMYVAPENETSENKMFWCRHPSANWTIGPPFFVSFIVIAAMVMLSLFIGAVTISMTESMFELKDLNRKAKALAAVEHNMKRMDAMMKRKAVAERAKEKARKKALADLQKEREIANGTYVSGRNSPTTGEEDRVDASQRSGSPTAISAKFSGTSDENGNGELEEEEEEEEDEIAPLKKKQKKYPCIAWYYQWKIDDLEKIIEDAKQSKEKIGKALRIAIGQDTMHDLDLTIEQRMQNEQDKKDAPSGLTAMYLHLGAKCKKIVNHSLFGSFMTGVICVASINVGVQTDWRVMKHKLAIDILDILDMCILYTFTAEIVLKMISEGFTPLVYFKDGWNKFDFLIVAGSYVPGAGSSVTLLRLLRLLRVLKLVKRLPQLAVIINALLNGLVSIAYVGLVLLLFFYVFSIVAMMLFQDNDPWHFGSLHMALLSLFQAATQDDWTMLMYTSMHGCDRYGGIYWTYPDQCVSPKAHGVVAVFFFLVFILIGAQVLLSLFIGVISTSMDEAKDAQAAEIALEEKITKTAKKLFLDEKRVEAMLYVFHQLDLDAGGTIEEEELKIGLDAIDAGMSEDEIIRILQKVAPEGGGVDPNGFILFMYETPMFGRTNAISKISNAFASTNKQKLNSMKRKHNCLTQWLVDTFYYLGRSNRIWYEQMEASLVIQDLWFVRKEARRVKDEAKRIIEEKLKNDVEMQKRKERIQRSLQNNSEDA